MYKYKLVYVADPPGSDDLVLHSVFPDYVELGSYFDDFDWYVIRIDPDRLSDSNEYVLDHLFSFKYSDFQEIYFNELPF